MMIPGRQCAFEDFATGNLVWHGDRGTGEVVGHFDRWIRVHFHDFPRLPNFGFSRETVSHLWKLEKDAMIFKLWMDDPRVGLGWRHFLVLSRGRKWVRLLAISSFDTLKLSIEKFDSYRLTPISFPRARLLKRLRVNAAIYHASDSLRAEALRVAAAILPPAKGAAGTKVKPAPSTQGKDNDMKSASSYSARSAALRAMKKQHIDATHEVKPSGDRFTIVPKATKAAKAAKPAEKTKKLGQRAQIVADAEAGKLPPVPDFSAETHTRFRPKLAELVQLVKVRDIKGLKAYPIKPISTSPKAMDRYRNLAVIALEAQAKTEKKAA